MYVNTHNEKNGEEVKLVRLVDRWGSAEEEVVNHALGLGVLKLVTW